MMGGVGAGLRRPGTIRRFSLATGIDAYFCEPRSPWQRVSSENTHGLLRWYFPKGTDLSVYSQAHLNKVARQLNERPRQALEFEAPAEKLARVLRRSWGRWPRIHIVSIV